MVKMLAVEPNWHQRLDFTTQEFIPVVSENLFGLRIQQDYFPIVVGDDHRIGC
jgi:hypothetical protein